MSLSRASFCSSANWDADWLSTPGLVGGVRLCWLHQCCLRLGLWGGGRSQKGWKQKKGRKKTSDVCVQTHLLGWGLSSTSTSSSTSSSEHCTSRWMWLGEEGETWDEEEGEEEDKGEEPL